jgi:hypothetical protein
MRQREHAEVVDATAVKGSVCAVGAVRGVGGVSQSTLEDWGRRGVIPSRKIGRRRIYIRSRIEAFLLDEEPQDG